MAKQYSVSLDKIIAELSLETVYMPETAHLREVMSGDTNRPGLALAGFYGYFDSERIQILGKSEISYLEALPEDTRMQRIAELTAHRPPAIVVTRGLEANAELVTCCEKDRVPLLKSKDSTSAFMAALIAYLSVKLAPRITNHGVFVEVYGEGVLLVGDSGVGKSETAIELVKRGHRLIADDAVEISRVSAKTLVGTSPENIRHFIELRGVGIVNARQIFGMGAVKTTERIDMVIRLEPWDNDKVYDRMGLDTEYVDILGIQLPQITIPVKPGRNLAIIIEVAAMNHRQKKMGYNAAYELMQNLGMADDLPSLSAGGTEDWTHF